MGRLMDIWAPEIKAALRANGSAVRQTESLDVERWRRAARQAGNSLGWSIRTGVSADGSTVWATSPDFIPAKSELTSAAQIIGSAIYGSDSRSPRRGRG